ncbi:DNA replication complex GINS protein-like protein psf3 [Nadsonia fulvescens var. elongata DSM 6958]|uniref:DNA replication complex GINS protein PSF3 n=1 Tax=Nadsonia fulvescens var. elongata DSM 6958 TaxID=857566 RepID=A0A1E3PJY2_9ASCO|nr:DNA replication complex GINS protein-like protein psf3 [Nadsonia fulvescens var. elongata DSM 6958]
MNNYYDIDDILADGQKVPCNFEITVPGLGYLQGHMDGDMKENTKLELPLWMAELLAVSGVTPDSPNSFISLLSPPPFGSKVLNALKSDPLNVDLKQQCSVYYLLAERWLSIFGDVELATILMETLKKRASLTYDYAHNSRGAQYESDFAAKLDEFERKMFKTAHDSAKDLRKWLVKRS